MDAKDILSHMVTVEPTPELSPSTKEAVRTISVRHIPLGEIKMLGIYKTPHGYMPHGKPSEHCAVVKPWWCAPEHVKGYRALCADWTSNGFMMAVGSTSDGTEPDVITDVMHERGVNKPFAPSSKGYEARVGHKKIWLEIRNTESALRFMRERDDIPLPVVCDIKRYNTDAEYKLAYNLAHEQFIEHFRRSI